MTMPAVRAPAAAAAARIDGISTSVSPGITGATITPTGTPASVSARTAPPRGRRAGAGLHDARQRRIEGRDADVDVHQPGGGQRGEQIEIARDQRVFRDDADRLPRCERHFQALPREAKFALGGLVAIGHARECYGFGLPRRPGEKLAEQCRGIVLDQNFRLEIQPGVEPQILVRWPGVAIREARAQPR